MNAPLAMVDATRELLAPTLQDLARVEHVPRASLELVLLAVPMSMNALPAMVVATLAPRVPTRLDPVRVALAPQVSL